MSTFADQLLLRFLDNLFVVDLLTNQLGLQALADITYKNLKDIKLHDIALGPIQSREFLVPAFETIRTNGFDERIMPTAERVKIDRAQPRYGRLAWVDVLLDVTLATKVESKAMHIESITSESLLEKLGGVASLNDLKTKLVALYSQTVVDAFFEQLRIASVEDFKSHPTLFLEFAFKTAPPFNPADPKNAQTFKLNVCVQFQAELKVTETLQSAKLCRSILENEGNFVQVFAAGDLETPYAFVVIFSDSAIKDNALPGLSAAQIKASIKDLFQAERMLAHFL